MSDFRAGLLELLEPMSPSASRVLVVEESPEQRSTLTALLRDAGIDATGSDGRRALTHIEKLGPYHLLVFSLRLTGADAQFLLQECGERGIPALAVAPAYAEFEAREACRIGADSVWALPVDPERFLDRVRELLQRRPREETETTRRSVRTVLVVDDTDMTRRWMRRVLESTGYSVFEAANGPACLRIVSTRKVDLVVLDVVMPDLDGLTVCAILKSQPPTADIPVLICTVRSGDDDQLQAIAAAADGYLAKPFRPEELINKVGALLQPADRVTR